MSSNSGKPKQKFSPLAPIGVRGIQHESQKRSKILKKGLKIDLNLGRPIDVDFSSIFFDFGSQDGAKLEEKSIKNQSKRASKNDEKMYAVKMSQKRPQSDFLRVDSPALRHPGSGGRSTGTAVGRVGWGALNLPTRRKPTYCSKTT